MPRVKPLIRPDPRATAILSEIGGAMRVCHVNQAELARLTGIPASTLSDRMKDVGSMRLSELWAIQDALKRKGAM